MGYNPVLPAQYQQAPVVQQPVYQVPVVQRPVYVAPPAPVVQKPVFVAQPVVEEPAKTCVDTFSRCDNWTTQCGNKSIKTFCAKTCGVCGNPAPAGTILYFFCLNTFFISSDDYFETRLYRGNSGSTGFYIRKNTP